MGLNGVTGIVQSACQKVFGFGKGKGSAIGSTIRPRPPEDGCCEFPENPFPNINGGNPSSWLSGITDFMSGLFGTRVCLESESTKGLLGDPSFNPQENIHKKFIVSVLLAKMYDLLKWVAEMFRQNLKAESDTIELFKPARSTVAVA